MLTNGGNAGLRNPEALRTADNYILVLHTRYGAQADQLIKQNCENQGLDYGSFCQNVGEFTLRMLPAVHKLHASGNNQATLDPEDEDIKMDTDRAISLYQIAGCSIAPAPTELGVAA